MDELQSQKKCCLSKYRVTSLYFPTTVVDYLFNAQYCIWFFLPSNAFFGFPSSFGSNAGAEGGGGPEGPEGVREEVKSPVARCCIFKAKRTQEAMANK